LQPGAKESIHQIWMAETRQDASDAFDLFLATYEAKYPKACECLSKDRPELLTFYDFGARPRDRITRPIGRDAAPFWPIPTGWKSHDLKCDASYRCRRTPPRRRQTAQYQAFWTRNFPA
jgi:hypothetical protein